MCASMPDHRQLQVPVMLKNEQENTVSGALTQLMSKINSGLTMAVRKNYLCKQKLEYKFTQLTVITNDFRLVYLTIFINNIYI